MAVIHGMKARTWLNGYDLGGWLNSCKSSHKKDVLDKTTLNSPTAKSYVDGLRSGTYSLDGFYDNDTTAALAAASLVQADTGDYMLDAAVQLQSGVEAVGLFCPNGGTTVGDRAIIMAGQVTSYDIGVNDDQLESASMEIESCYGREVAKIHSPMASRTNAHTGTTVDNTASSANGGTGVVQCTDWVSGTLPALIQHSTDDISYSTLVTFTNITADHAGERVAVSGTVNRYTRGFASGTYNATFQLAFCRK